MNLSFVTTPVEIYPVIARIKTACSWHDEFSERVPLLHDLELSPPSHIDSYVHTYICIYKVIYLF